MKQAKILLALLAIAGVIGLISFLSSPYFQIRQINIQGLDKLQPATVREHISYLDHKNIWLVSKNRVRYRLQEDNYIKQAKVYKKYPDQIVVQIREHIPLAKINNDGEYLVFDGSGYIIEKGPLTGRVEVPEIRGVAYGFDGDRLNFPPVLDELVQVLKSLNPSVRDRIKLIARREEDGLVLHLKQETRVLMGSPRDIKEKFRVLISVLDRQEKQGQQLDYVDLRLPARPVIKVQKD
ncbi:MAG: cell division protein FtsQ/DivIB [Bacillota bacterium]